MEPVVITSSGKTLATLLQIAAGQGRAGHSKFVLAKLQAQGLIERSRDAGWVVTELGRASLAATEASKADARQQYAPGWRVPGVPVRAKLRASDRGYRRDEIAVGVWDRYKGRPGMWVVARRPEDVKAGPWIFLDHSKRLADVRQAERDAVPAELLADKGGRLKPTHAERTEIAQRAGKAGGRPRVEGGDRREVFAIRLPVDVIEDLRRMGAERGEKPASLAADMIAQAVNGWRRR